MSTVVFTSSSLRHKAFASIISNNLNLNVAAIFNESGFPLNELIEKKNNNQLEMQHLGARQLTEEDFFSLYLKSQKKFNSLSQTVPRGWFSTEDCFNKLSKINPNQILVYGTSIIRGELIKKFKNRILNLHLGLSPYYRGSGTNYFPFVNNEPEYAGSTFMYLDAGIDTGEIIHQIRPLLNSTDSFHQFSNRFLIKSFETFSRIAECNLLGELKKPIISSKHINKKRLLYKKSDFSRENIIDLYNNLKDGMIEKFLENRFKRCLEVPILEQEWLKG